MTTRTPDRVPTLLAAAGLALALLGAPGCSAKYPHEEIALDGAVAKKIVARVDALRKAGADEAAFKAVVRDQLASGLAPDMAAGLETALADLAKGNEVKLIQLDRFGKVLSAGFRVTGPDASGLKECFFLLTDESSPRWIKSH